MASKKNPLKWVFMAGLFCISSPGEAMLRRALNSPVAAGVAFDLIDRGLKLSHQNLSQRPRLFERPYATSSFERLRKKTVQRERSEGFNYPEHCVTGYAVHGAFSFQYDEIFKVHQWNTVDLFQRYDGQTIKIQVTNKKRQGLVEGVGVDFIVMAGEKISFEDITYLWVLL